MNPEYNLEKIKFGIDERTWEKAVILYERGKVKNFQDTGFTFTANVYGTQLYDVIVSPKSYGDGNCTCYLGENDTLCKHMIAVAIYALKKGKLLTAEEKTQHNEIKFCGKIGNMTPDQLNIYKVEISGAIRYIKAYTGPSRIWFAYQDSLSEGCNRLSSIFSLLPASRQTANLIIKTLLRLDRKLTTGGVDDSDGTVGGFIEEAVSLLIEFAKINPECIKEFENLKGKETCFGWEDPLLKLLKEKTQKF
jgi:hypothetical protein